MSSTFLSNIFNTARLPGSPIETVTGFVETFSYFTGITEDGGLFSTTADKGTWLVTADTFTSNGWNPRAMDNADGGYMEMACDDDAGDHTQAQVNGEMFYPTFGRPLIFQARMKTKLVADKWFVGIAVNSTDGIASAPADYIGIGSAAGGATLQWGAGYDSSDSSVMTLTDTSPAITVVADTFFSVGFEWDGLDTVTFWHHNESTGVLTKLGTLSSSVSPTGSKAEYMSPVLIIENPDAADTFDATLTFDTLVCVQKGK